MSNFYVLPVGIRPMSSWRSHQLRDPRSTEPGTDFYCPIGTPIKAPADGKIYAVGDSITPAAGRWVGIDFDDGRRFRALHLQRRTVSPGQRVSRSQIIGYSGASGYGKEDWSDDPNTGGAHVHVTLWPDQRMLFGYRTIDGKSVPYTIDFYVHAALGDLAGGGSAPFDPSKPGEVAPQRKATKMTVYARLTNGTVYAVPEGGPAYAYPSLTEYEAARGLVIFINERNAARDQPLLAVPPTAKELIDQYTMSEPQLHRLMQMQGSR